MARVSIITPTRNREHFLPVIARCVMSQAHADWEWLIDDDSDMPSSFLRELSARDSRIHYRHRNEVVSIGFKRNGMIARATGEFIAHFDDDDYYAPNYLQFMLSTLVEHQADLIKFSGFFVYSPAAQFLGYMDLTAKVGHHYMISNDRFEEITFHDKMQIGADFIVFYGYSYVFRRDTALRFPFRDISLSEDEHFAKDLVNHGAQMITTDDPHCTALHILHPGSTARCFARDRLPTFLLQKLFPGYVNQ